MLMKNVPMKSHNPRHSEDITLTKTQKDNVRPKRNLSILGESFKPPENVLGASWEPPGSLLGASWKPPGKVLEASWEPPGSLLGASWEPPKD